MKVSYIALALSIAANAAVAAPSAYTVDPEHTHPSFEVDHLGGLSIWRGTFKKSTGTITLDPAAGTGTVDIQIDTASVDLANDKLNEHVAGPDILDSANFPTAKYHGTLGKFVNGAPTTVTGELTLHGVTKPVALTIRSFKCITHPMSKKEVCGADAAGTFNRADFGVNFGQKFGFKQYVDLRIQVEAIKQ